MMYTSQHKRLPFKMQSRSKTMPWTRVDPFCCVSSEKSMIRIRPARAVPRHTRGVNGGCLSSLNQSTFMEVEHICSSCRCSLSCASWELSPKRAMSFFSRGICIHTGSGTNTDQNTVNSLLRCRKTKTEWKAPIRRHVHVRTCRIHPRICYHNCGRGVAGAGKLAAL